MIILSKEKKEKKQRGPKFLPSPIKTPMINYKEYYFSAGERILYFLLTFVIGGIVGLVFYGGLFKVDGERTVNTYISDVVVFVVVGAIAAKVFIPAINKMLKEKRDKTLIRQFCNMLESLSVSLSSGTTVNDSFVNAKNDMISQYTDKAYISVELSEIVSGIENGMTLETMVADFGKRSGNDDIENFANVISNCYRMGGDFKSVVRKTRDIISDKVSVEEEIKTKLSSNKLQHSAMSLMPIAIILMLKFSSSSFAENLSNATGVVITTIAVVIFVASYFWGKKIIDIK